MILVAIVATALAYTATSQHSIGSSGGTDVVMPKVETDPTTTSAPAKVTTDQTSVKALLLTIHQLADSQDYDTIARCSNDMTRSVLARNRGTPY